MADLTAHGVGWGVGQLGKEAEEWVLASQASHDGKLKGFLFVTLERIGGTPAMVIGVASTARTKSSSMVLRALMKEQYHRALMAFPDEDVLVAIRVDQPGGMEALDRLTEIRPAVGVRANGEERAWGRRLSKRYGAAGFDDRSMVAKGDGDHLVVDHEPSGGFDGGTAFDAADLDQGAFVIAWAWAMAEFLETYAKV